MFEASVNKQFKSKFSGISGQVDMGAIMVMRRIFNIHTLESYLLLDKIKQIPVIMRKEEFEKLCRLIKVDLERTSNIPRAKVVMEGRRKFVEIDQFNRIPVSDNSVTCNQWVSQLNGMYLQALGSYRQMAVQGMNFSHYEVLYRELHTDKFEPIKKVYTENGIPKIHRVMNQRNLNAEEFAEVLLAIAYIGTGKLEFEDLTKVCENDGSGARAMHTKILRLIDGATNRAAKKAEEESIDGWLKRFRSFVPNTIYDDESFSPKNNIVDQYIPNSNFLSIFGMSQIIYHYKSGIDKYEIPAMLKISDGQIIFREDDKLNIEFKVCDVKDRDRNDYLLARKRIDAKVAAAITKYDLDPENPRKFNGDMKPESLGRMIRNSLERYPGTFTVENVIVKRVVRLGLNASCNFIISINIDAESLTTIELKIDSSCPGYRGFYYAKAFDKAESTGNIIDIVNETVDKAVELREEILQWYNSRRNN